MGQKEFFINFPIIRISNRSISIKSIIKVALYNKLYVSLDVNFNYFYFFIICTSQFNKNKMKSNQGTTLSNVLFESNQAFIK
jgi:hypothetical protein